MRQDDGGAAATGRSVSGDADPVGSHTDVPWASDGVTPTTPGRSRNMAAIRRSDTKPEILLRQALHARGYRFRKDLRVDACGTWVRPDVAFTRRRVAVFVDGCFWHSCPEHGRAPSVNGGYWGPKFERTRQRDDRDTAALESAGWTVVRLWEHLPIDEALDVIETAIRSRN